MRKYNLTALVALSFIANAGYGMDDTGMAATLCDSLPTSGVSTEVTVLTTSLPEDLVSPIAEFAPTEFLAQLSKTSKRNRAFYAPILAERKAAYESAMALLPSLCETTAPLYAKILTLPIDQRVAVVRDAKILIGDLYGEYRDAIIKTLEKISPKRLPNFMRHAQALTVGMGRDKSFFVQDLGNVSPERLTPQFIDYAKDLTIGMSRDYYLRYIIQALGNVSPERLTPQFIDYAKQLTVGMGRDKSSVVQALGNVSPERLTPNFVRCAQDLMVGTFGECKLDVIKALGAISPEKIDEFVLHIQALTVGMRGDGKADVIKNLASVLPEDAPKFLGYVQVLTEGKDEWRKHSVIEILGRFSKSLTPEFVSRVKALSAGMTDEHDVMESLMMMAVEFQENLMEFADYIHILTDGMDEWDKHSVINALKLVVITQKEKLTLEFMRNVQSSTAEMDAKGKSDFITTLGQVPSGRHDMSKKDGRYFYSEDGGDVFCD